MKAALIYDRLDPSPVRAWVEAEYETPETVAALLAALEARCGRAVPIPFEPSLVADLEREAPDLAFNIAEGWDGPSRESIVPAILDHLGVPYTGSDAVALGMSLNKALTKRLAAGAGVSTPAFGLFTSGRQAAERRHELTYPVLLKPNFGGSSVGVGPGSLVEEPADLAGRVEDYVARYEQPCLAEHYVVGADVTVGLLGNGEVQVLPPARILAPDGMYSEQVKQRHDREVICPCALPGELTDELIRRALTVYELIGARDFARVDFMVDEEGRARFLEINPLPGLSPYYGVFPVLAAAAGYSHTELIGAVVDLALERHRHARNLAHGYLAR
jgi:D-alanine-D-alanine ligase